VNACMKFALGGFEADDSPYKSLLIFGDAYSNINTSSFVKNSRNDGNFEIFWKNAPYL